MRWGLVVHHERALAHELARGVLGWSDRAGVDISLLPDDADRLGRPDLVDGWSRCEGIVAIGGDGTVLRGVSMAGEPPVPVLGVNAGQLGYLTDVEPGDLEVALTHLAAGELRIERRMSLDVVHEDAAGNRTPVGRALNEAVVERREPGHTVRLLLDLDGQFFTSYLADGLIVATPTGSTAYAFSARGPIIDPHHEAIQLTPVAPHMLFDRSLVLRPTAEVTVRVNGHRAAQVCLDGRPGPVVEPGERILCRRAVHDSQLARFGSAGFHAVLKSKFGLNDR